MATRWKTIDWLKGLRRPAAPVVAVVRLTGMIGDVGEYRQGLSLMRLAAVLETAFTLRNLSAVAIVINSPGGSAVQSALISTRIRSLALEHNVPVIAFVEDVAASGGYWLACSADEILAHEASIVGSIGVVAAVVSAGLVISLGRALIMDDADHPVARAEILISASTR